MEGSASPCFGPPVLQHLTVEEAEVVGGYPNGGVAEILAAEVALVGDDVVGR